MYCTWIEYNVELKNPDLFIFMPYFASTLPGNFSYEICARVFEALCLKFVVFIIIPFTTYNDQTTALFVYNHLSMEINTYYSFFESNSMVCFFSTPHKFHASFCSFFIFVTLSKLMQIIHSLCLCFVWGKSSTNAIRCLKK